MALLSAAALLAALAAVHAAAPASPSPSPSPSPPAPLPSTGLYEFRSSVGLGLFLTTCKGTAYSGPMPPSPPYGAPNSSFVFSIGPALTGMAGAVSLALASSPGSYLTVVEGGGLAALPRKFIEDLANASFVLVPGLSDPANTVSLQSLTRDPSTYGYYVSVGPSLDGPCEDLFEPPASSLLLTSGSNTVVSTWTLVGPMPPPLPPQCGNLNACRHVWYDALGRAWTYDLCKLCRERGFEYTWTDAYNHTYVWNIGANAGGNGGPGGAGQPYGKCTPPWQVFVSTGIMRQFWTLTPVCPPTGPDGTCTDPENGNKPVCCSGDCAVMALLGPTPTSFWPVNSSDPGASGISLSYQGLPPDASDPFQCSFDPSTGCSRSRALTQTIYCDPNGTPETITFLGISEPSQCQYLLEARSKAACGVKEVRRVGEDRDDL
jgi:hypothetical protein